MNTSHRPRYKELILSIVGIVIAVSESLTCSKGRLAIVSSLVGNREGSHRLNEATNDYCTDFHLYTIHDDVEAKGWLQHRLTSPLIDKTWFKNVNLISGYNVWSNTSTLDVANILKAKIAKLKLMDLDDLKQYNYIVWVDASVKLKKGLYERVMSLIQGKDLIILAHPHRFPRTILSEAKYIHKNLHEHSFFHNKMFSQIEFYKSMGYNDNQGLFWCAMIIHRRSMANAALLDLWWDQILVWQHRDQISLPFSIWMTKMNHNISISVLIEDLKLTTIEKSINLKIFSPRRQLCRLALGYAGCCRRC